MAIKITNGWIDGFLRIGGHPLKLYSEPNTGDLGLACHSVVGEEPDEQDGIPNRFLSDERNADGSFTDAAAASAMFVLRKRMPSIQMYPITASTWTSGGRAANTSTWAMEAEGGRVGNESEPLTTKQENEFLLIASAWEQVKGRKLVVGETVWAHWQLAKKFGYAATACESGRYANAWARLAAGERVGASVQPVVLADIVAALGGDQAIRDWNKNGNSLLLGYALEQQRQAVIEQTVGETRARLRALFQEVADSLA